MSLDSVSSTSSRLKWVGGSQSYRVKVSTTSINPETGSGFIDTIVNQNFIKLLNLTEQTTYYYYVQGDCSIDGNSEWSNESTFKTLCSNNPRVITGMLYKIHCKWILGA